MFLHALFNYKKKSCLRNNLITKIIKISYFVTQFKLVKKNYDEFCRTLAKISPYIRFVAVIGNRGELVSHYRRHGLKPLLSAKDMQYTSFHILQLKLTSKHFLIRVLVQLSLYGKNEKKFKQLRLL